MSGRVRRGEKAVTGSDEPDLVCAGQPPPCPYCQVPLIADRTGPWCRRCRRAWPGSPAHARCPNTAVATGNTPRTRGLRLCRAHARLLADPADPAQRSSTTRRAQPHPAASSPRRSTPENTPPNAPRRTAPDAVDDHSAAQKAVVVAVGASVVLTAGWGLLSGLTERHFTIVLPVIGAVIALALTSTPARRSWFPALAAWLGFAVGYLGDIAAVALLLWRNGVSLSVIANHALDLARAVNDGHSASDWAFFLGSGAIAYAATAARQKARPTHAEPAGPR